VIFETSTDDANTAGCVVTGNQLTFSSIGTCYVDAYKNADNDYAADTTTADVQVEVIPLTNYITYATGIVNGFSGNITPTILSVDPTEITGFTYNTPGTSNPITLYGTGLQNITKLTFTSGGVIDSETVSISGTNVTSAPVADPTGASSLTGTGCFNITYSYVDTSSVTRLGSALTSAYQYNCAPSFAAAIINPATGFYAETPTTTSPLATVTLLGYNFTQGSSSSTPGASIGSATVTIDGIPISATVYQPTTTPTGLAANNAYKNYEYLTFTIPSNIPKGSAPITVTTTGGLSATTNFSITVG
jgi:hypothetical protein